MKTFRSFPVFILILVFMSGGLAHFSSESALAAEAAGMVFSGEYDDSASTLTVKAYLVNPAADINSGMFVLDYDKSVLTTDGSKITLGSDISSGAKYSDTSGGHIGVDWFPKSTIASSTSQRQIASVVFNVANGKSLDDVKKSLSICDDTDYLNDIGGYGDDGGVLLCKNSTNTYGTKDKTASATINISLKESEETSSSKSDTTSSSTESGSSPSSATSSVPSSVQPSTVQSTAPINSGSSSGGQTVSTGDTTASWLYPLLIVVVIISAGVVVTIYPKIKKTGISAGEKCKE